MKKCLTTFNALVEESEKLCFPEVKGPSSDIFKDCFEPSQIACLHPWKRILLVWCREEEELVKCEMICLLQEKFTQLQSLKESCMELNNSGLKSLLRQKGAIIQGEISQLIKQWEG